MAEEKQSLLTTRTLIDLLLVAVCVGLLIMMLAQLDALKKLEGDVDRLRAKVDARSAVQQAPAPAAAQPADRKKP